MKRSLIVALAASATLGLSAMDLSAQGAGRGNGQGAQRGNAQAQAAQQRAAQQRGAQQRADQQRAERQRAAQQRGAQQRADQQRATERDRRDGGIFGDVRGTQQARGGSPAFCRSGAGHPVHGRRWCTQKGFGLGNERWDRVGGWEDVIFGQPRDRRRYDDGSIMNRGTLADVLGGVVLGRFEGYGRQHGSGPVTGQWLTGVDGRILQLYVGGIPFAQLVDSRNRGRVDSVLLRR
ncbi:MAG TPA: hypothetical protein VK929_14120 [Longimicrobiales bacterium]|nr:hypothetical protein [Longimicrobiales bacterium]